PKNDPVVYTGGHNFFTLSRIIQDSEKIAAYSFIHSLSTSLGMSLYEEISVIVAKPHCEECFRNYGVGGVISQGQKKVIEAIIRELRNKNRKPDIKKEMQAILKADRKNASSQKSGNIADFYMKRKGKEFYFEIKTVKPNIDVFKESKNKLLEWTARKRKLIYPYLAFPYNPYHPKPYERFTQANFVKMNEDFLIGEKYWDFLGGRNTFHQLLDVFDTIGKKYKKELVKKFKEIAKEKIDSY
ncbi:MAG: TdeIII family type II restriction endonuclease, partial [Oligoflexia bacterium]|nr:TdeIII family type II restriction endonuclease [Oligoflexia bacterium]